MSEKKYRKAVFIVTYFVSNKKIYYLLLKRKLHWVGWEFPKGGIKNNEKKLDTIKRELKEETGSVPLSIKKFNIFGRYKYEKGIPGRKYIGQTYSLYSAEIKKKKIKFDKIEHSAYKWLEFKDAVKTATWANQKRCLKIVDEWLGKKKKI